MRWLFLSENLFRFILITKLKNCTVVKTRNPFTRYCECQIIIFTFSIDRIIPIAEKKLCYSIMAHNLNYNFFTSQNRSPFIWNGNMIGIQVKYSFDLIFFFMFWTNIDECIFPHIIESGRIQLSVFANVVYTYLCSHSLPSIHTFFFIKSSSSSVHISFFPLYLFLNEKTNLCPTEKKRNAKNTHLTCNYTCDTFYSIVHMVFCCAFLRFSLLTVRRPQLTL